MHIPFPYHGGTGTVREYDIIIVGAGILGLSTAFHMLNKVPDQNVMVIERLKGAGKGNTAKSAAAYRDMFTSPLNRQLASGSISYYEETQERRGGIGLRRVGYLWLMTEEQIKANREALEYIASVSVVFETLEPKELKKHLPGLEPGDIYKGVLGSRCGILNQHNLSSHYEEEVQRLGGKFQYDTMVTGLIEDKDGTIKGVRTVKEEIEANTVVIATGAWMGETLGSIGVEVPVVPKKRQLFSIRTNINDLKGLLNTKGLNSHDLLPFTILPEGAYLRPAANSIIVGFSDGDRKEGLDNKPKAENEFFKKRIRPQLEKYFPAFKGIQPEQSWAGHYAYHLPDNVPFIDRVKGAILIGGASGSGVMKADSLGRIATGFYLERKEVELGDRSFFKVSELALDRKGHPPEEFVI